MLLVPINGFVWPLVVVSVRVASSATILEDEDPKESSSHGHTARAPETCWIKLVSDRTKSSPHTVPL